MIVSGLQFCFHRVKTFAAVTPVLRFLCWGGCTFIGYVLSSAPTETALFLVF